ncbi:MAG TPA: alpha/beta hydrolase [Stenomitos sp.]
MLHSFIRRCTPWASALSLSCLGLAIGVPIAPTLAASKVSAIYGPLEIAVPVSDVEAFVKSGAVSSNFKTYIDILSAQQQADLRSVLQEKLDVNTTALEQFGKTSMGQELLKRLSSVLQTDPGQDGGVLLLEGILAAAKDPQGLTILSLLRNFPVDNLRIKVEPLLQAQKELTALLKYRDTTITAMAKAMDTEAASAPRTNFAKAPDLRNLGPFKVQRQVLDLSNNRDRQSISGRAIGLQFKAAFYLPQDSAAPAPVVVISHGLGSAPQDFGYLAEHLASYGFAVALPQHIGSDATRLQTILDGQSQGDISPVEFVDRPLGIKYLLDAINQLSTTNPMLKGRLNLQSVGIIGHSFGGYTSLALAGAGINHERLRQECDDTQPTFNLSLILQCRAKSLPPFNYNLEEPRIKAVVAVNPFDSAIFGPEGLGDIKIPTLLVSGSHDVVTPAITEQVHPFLWLKTPDKYLALLTNAGHTFSVFPPQVRSASVSTSVKGLEALLAGDDPFLSREYLKAISLAFLQTYLENRPSARQYLSAAYAKYLSRKPVQFQLVRSLQPKQLEQAYGGPLPIPVVPPLATTSPTRSESVLETIRKSGVFKAGIRSTAPPFGMVGAGEKPSGYCADLLGLMAQELQSQLKTPIRLQWVPSGIDNRFSMVQDGAAQVECGPNTISADPALKTTFSTPFFITGTHFLVKATNQGRLDPKSFPPSTVLGTYSQTTTAKVVDQRYPNLKKVYFKGDKARINGFQALSSGKIDALAGDGILLVSTLKEQKNVGNQFALVPEQPLVCDAYGLILPQGDRVWETTVNRIIGSAAARQVWDKWFKTLYPYIYLNIDYCAKGS